MEAATVQDDTAQEVSSQGPDTAKKIRNLQKKLKQIQQLKDKRDSANVLTPEQMQKVASEQSVLLEVQQLEQTLQSQ